MYTIDSQINEAKLLALIDVQAPYFALKDLIIETNGGITAKIFSEQELGFEVYPITSSEAGRHLAVLGSCACAFANPVKAKHYYLASMANATRCNFNFEAPVNNLFIGKAFCEKIDSRGAIARTQLLLPNNEVFSEIIIQYHVIHHKIFERINQKRMYEPASMSGNPYVADPYVYHSEVSEQRVISYIHPLTPDDCLGHFEKIRAVPIAILFRILTKIAIYIAQVHTHQPKAVFCVKECTIEAKNLAFPGEQIDFIADFIHTDEKGNHLIKVEAFTNCDCCVGAVEMVLFQV